MTPHKKHLVPARTYVKGGTLKPFELYTVLLEVANLVNQRPIGRIPNDPDDGSYICPNDILLGRQGNEKPMAQGRVRSTDCGVVLEALGQRCVSNTHSEEEMAYRATQCTSWRCRSTLGDNKIRGKWTICRVMEVYPVPDGRVRNVKVKKAESKYLSAVTKIAVIYPAEGYD